MRRVSLTNLSLVIYHKSVALGGSTEHFTTNDGFWMKNTTRAPTDGVIHPDVFFFESMWVARFN